MLHYITQLGWFTWQSIGIVCRIYIKRSISLQVLSLESQATIRNNKPPLSISPSKPSSRIKYIFPTRRSIPRPSPSLHSLRFRQRPHPLPCSLTCNISSPSCKHPCTCCRCQHRTHSHPIPSQPRRIPCWINTIHCSRIWCCLTPQYLPWLLYQVPGIPRDTLRSPPKQICGGSGRYLTSQHTCIARITRIWSHEVSRREKVVRIARHHAAPETWLEALVGLIEEGEAAGAALICGGSIRPLGAKLVPTPPPNPIDM